MKVKFVPQNIELEINPGQSVLDLAQQNDIHIQSVCKGIPSCAECRVYIKEGDHNVMPPQPKELELIGTAYFIDQRRLSCQLRCFGDVVIDLTEQIEKQNKSTKNPQGRYVKEREDSKARMGNLLEELTDEEKEYEKELEAERKNSEQRKTENSRASRIDTGSFYKISNAQNTKASSGRSQAPSESTTSSDKEGGRAEGSGKRNRNKRRNKNRNKNLSAGQNNGPNKGNPNSKV